MTNTAILTPEAQAYLERYLRKVRGALRGQRGVDADDVERDVISEEDDLGARRWLVYPPLLIFYLPTVIALLGWPLALAAGASEELPRVRPDLWEALQPVWLGVPWVVLLVAGLWWTVTGMISTRLTPAIRTVFYPLANWFEPRHGRVLMAVGFSLFALGGTLLFATARL